MKKDYLKYLLSLLLFGSNGIVASRISLSSCDIVLLRCLLGSLLLLAVFFLSGRRLHLKGNGRDYLFIALSGAAMAADWFFLFEAYASIGVSLGTIINYCGPAVVVALSPFIFRERLTRRRLLATTAALAGAFLISGQAASGGIELKGLFFAVMSALGYSAMIIFDKLSKNVRGMENSLIQLLSALAAAAVYVGLRQGWSMDISAGELPFVLWLGLINTGLCCFLYFSAVSCLPVQTVAICGYLEPVSGIVLALIFLHEHMGALQIVGTALIITGALIGEGLFSSKKRGRFSPSHC